VTEEIPKSSTGLDWKNHPVVVAAAVCAASLVFAQQVIFPVMTASLQNELVAYKTQAADVKSPRDRIAVLEAQLKDTPADLAKIQTANMFSLGSPYPIGLGQIKLGDSLDLVTKFYPSGSIERKSIYWTVARPNAAFASVAYFFDRNASDKRATTIQFYLNTDTPINLLQTKLVEALGQPTYSGPKKDCAVWKLNDQLFVRKGNSRTLSIGTIDFKCAED
jgi:hypothetical protein